MRGGGGGRLSFPSPLLLGGAPCFRLCISFLVFDRLAGSGGDCSGAVVCFWKNFGCL